MNTTFINANSKIYNAVSVPVVAHKRLQNIHETVSLLYKYNRLTYSVECGREIFFFYLGFLSRTFTNRSTAEEGGGHFFNSSPPVPPTSQTLRY